ncbi:hypothetical protein LTR37_008066 [Vermiconidia calcicola]|uniref:Uncharacterized protein n=1 Tax=Vermiconidia calcicola TaxID=1690605 RepID=A0ACC3ND73_9PEZI|nr:hypothetical protein LTR37_008066 [Vermiconidia calcicola]
MPPMQRPSGRGRVRNPRQRNNNAREYIDGDEQEGLDMKANQYSRRPILTRRHARHALKILADHLLGTYSLAANAKNDGKAVYFSVLDNLPDNELDEHMDRVAARIAEVDRNCFSGVHGQQYIKLYPYLIIRRKHKTFKALPMQTRKGKGVDNLPRDLRASYIPVFPDGYTGTIPTNTLPHIKLYNCIVEVGMTIVPSPVEMSYDEWLIPGEGLCRYMQAISADDIRDFRDSNEVTNEHFRDADEDISRQAGHAETFIKNHGYVAQREDSDEQAEVSAFRQHRQNGAVRPHAYAGVGYEEDEEDEDAQSESNDDDTTDSDEEDDIMAGNESETTNGSESDPWVDEPDHSDDPEDFEGRGGEDELDTGLELDTESQVDAGANLHVEPQPQHDVDHMPFDESHGMEADDDGNKTRSDNDISSLTLPADSLSSLNHPMYTFGSNLADRRDEVRQNGMYAGMNRTQRRRQQRANKFNLTAQAQGMQTVPSTITSSTQGQPQSGVLLSTYQPQVQTPADSFMLIGGPDSTINGHSNWSSTSDNNVSDEQTHESVTEDESGIQSSNSMETESGQAVGFSGSHQQQQQQQQQQGVACSRAPSPNNEGVVPGIQSYDSQRVISSGATNAFKEACDNFTSTSRGQNEGSELLGGIQGDAQPKRTTRSAQMAIIQEATSALKS